MRSHLSAGCSYPLNPIDKEHEIQDLKDAFDFGNHKGVSENMDLFKSIIDEEIKSGWIIPIPRYKALSLDNVIISPMNIASQLGINESGDIIEKKRITHNQSMEHSSKTSVNNKCQQQD